MNNPVLVIMAAGLGRRYGGLKQMAKIGFNNETIVHYSIYYAYKAGFKKVIFIIRESFYDEFNNLIGKFSKKFMNVEYVFQKHNDIINFIPSDKQNFFINKRIKPLGTAHVIYSIKDYIKENSFVLINADDFYSANSFINIINFLKHNDNDHCMISYLLKNTLSNNGTVSRGICNINKHNYLTQIKEVSDIKVINNKIISKNSNIELTNTSYVSMNMWGFNKNIFKYLDLILNEFCNKILINDFLNEEFTIPFFVNSLLKENKIKIKIISSLEKWFGITYKKDLNDIKLYFKEKKIYILEE